METVKVRSWWRWLLDEVLDYRNKDARELRDLIEAQSPPTESPR